MPSFREFFLGGKPVEAELNKKGVKDVKRLRGEPRGGLGDFVPVGQSAQLGGAQIEAQPWRNLGRDLIPAFALPQRFGVVSVVTDGIPAALPARAVQRAWSSLIGNRNQAVSGTSSPITVPGTATGSTVYDIVGLYIKNTNAALSATPGIVNITITGTSVTGDAIVIVLRVEPLELNWGFVALFPALVNGEGVARTMRLTTSQGLTVAFEGVTSGTLTVTPIGPGSAYAPAVVGLFSKRGGGE